MGAWLIIESKIENILITVLPYAIVRHQTPANNEFEDFIFITILPYAVVDYP
ncbi:MAG: hypothetical protein F6K48_10730 [Okeania sp. SIO3H1]|nr:hypothetical protein [Okeania sp. SIO3H1]